ncbi:MAG: type I restriction enzyme, S subunit [Rhodobacteraceae bacterium HLUCCO07]|nr:MAG: type I restriction enzyme, S subunit [Rhodobacteraceae bacterium HLUCCO07]
MKRILGDFVSLQRGTTYKSALLGKTGPVLLGLGSIAKNGGFRSDNLKTYGGDSDPRILLAPGDIYVSLKDVTQSADLLGAVARVPDAVPQGRLTQDTVKLVFEVGAPRDLIYWVLQCPQYREFCRSHSTGTTNLGLPREDFLSFPIPKETSDRLNLVSLFESIEQKIELNRKMNATLEAMARALFRDWFVDFGPTRAKMESHAPYLSPDLWSLFPDRLDDEGKPEGWEVSTIGDEVRVVGGSTPSTKEPEFWDGDINWGTPKDLSNLAAPVLLETSRTITAAGLAKISSGLLPVGTLLLSSRAPIGYLAISEVPVAINQGFIGMICDKQISNVFAWLWTIESREAIIANANGSTFQEISKRNFRPLPLLVPSEPVLEAFDAVAQSLYQRIAQNERESRTLAQTRDLLLPRLMSGELRVADLDQLETV